MPASGLTIDYQPTLDDFRDVAVHGVPPKLDASVKPAQNLPGCGCLAIALVLMLPPQTK